ncbi:hypothetical protein [Rhodoferax sp.]|nr:hypothetical protein [Rhodoferax sp.]
MNTLKFTAAALLALASAVAISAYAVDETGLSGQAAYGQTRV